MFLLAEWAPICTISLAVGPPLQGLALKIHLANIGIYEQMVLLICFCREPREKISNAPSEIPSLQIYINLGRKYILITLHTSLNKTTTKMIDTMRYLNTELPYSTLPAGRRCLRPTSLIYDTTVLYHTMTLTQSLELDQIDGFLDRFLSFFFFFFAGLYLKTTL